MTKRNAKEREKTFTKVVSVRGDLVSSFVFESPGAVQDWVKKEFSLLQQKYGNLTWSQADLPGLRVGDTCCVHGEGSEKFRITGVFLYSPHRYGFNLDSGFSEEVAKCYIDVAQ